jgi:di/tricarboxylate transporter
MAPNKLLNSSLLFKFLPKLLRSVFLTEISSWKSFFRIVIFATFLVSLFFVGDMVRVFMIIGMALYLFTTELLPVDMTALLIMLMLILTGLVSPDEGFSGFSNAATLTVLSMFILSAGVERTGLIKKLGGYLFKFAGSSMTRQILVIALFIGPISGFLNNTATVAIFLPMVVSLGLQAKTPITKLLIPLSFISMLGGTLTVIGTSTNVLASSLLTQYDMRPLGMFEFTQIGVIVLIIGVVYFLTIGRFLLPTRENEATEEDFLPDQFLATIRIDHGSRFIGKSVKQLDFETKFNLRVLKIVREEKAFIKALETQPIQENDLLVVSGDTQRIMDFDRRKKETVVAFDHPERRRTRGRIVKIIMKSNFFHQKTISEIKFWRRYNIALLGIHREELHPGHISNLKLQHGEVLLVKVSQTNLKRLRKSRDFMILEEVEGEYREDKSVHALVIIGGVVALAALNILPIAVSAMLGVLVMFLTKILRPFEVYDSVTWDVIFLLAGVIPLGIAMQKSGAADLIANTIVAYSGFMTPLVLLMVFYGLTTVLTEIISNNAAVVLLIPIGISVADKLDLNPIAFVLAVMFAASTSFLTPVGYQTNTMIYGSANYKFSDFIKVGGPLNLILLFVTSYLIYHFFGL